MSRLVIFDCDGVLVDSETVYVETERAFLARAGFEVDRDTYVRTYSGMPPAEWQARLAGDIREATGAAPGEDFFDEIRRQCRAAFEAGLEPVPGTRAMLESLAGPICVASSTLEEQLHWKLRRTGLHDLFDPHIFSTERVKRGKPAPDLFLHAAAAMGVPPARCIVVEDSANGVRAGRAAGMTVIGFTGGGHCAPGHGDMLARCGADVVIDSHARLGEAIGGALVGAAAAPAH